MPHTAIAFVESPGLAVIDHTGVRITYSSGGQHYTRHMAIDAFRIVVAEFQRELAKWDDAQSTKVVGFEHRAALERRAQS